MWLVLGADVPSGAGSVKAGVRVGGRHAGNHKILAWNQIYVRGAVQGKQSGTEGGGGVAYLEHNPRRNVLRGVTAEGVVNPGGGGIDGELLAREGDIERRRKILET